jgi:hypothetical protein
MPEAIAILAVTVFVTIILVIAALNSAGRSPGEKLALLHQRLAWLEEREQRALTNDWDAQMRANLAGQLQETRQAIAALKASAPPATEKEA